MPTKTTLAYKDTAIKNAKPDPAKTQTEYSIEGVSGLFLVVSRAGQKAWTVRYRVPRQDPKTGEMKSMSGRVKLGVYHPDVFPLAMARDECERLMAKIKKGYDPKQAREQKVEEAKAEAAQLTLRDLYRERLKHMKLSARTRRDYEQALDHDDVFDRLPGPAKDITTDQLSELLNEIEDRSPSAAHRVSAILKGTYRWAVSKRRGGVTQNPMGPLSFSHKSRRGRKVDPREIDALWSQISTFEGLSEKMRIMLKLGVLTAQRLTMVAGAMRSELPFLKDPNLEPTWHVPGVRTKNGSDQVLPLSWQAAELFKQAASLSNGPYLFPADTRRTRDNKSARVPHIHSESVSTAFGKVAKSEPLQEILADLRLNAPEGTEVPRLRFHDLRSACVTWVRENLKVPSDVAQAILHHSATDVTGMHYDFAQFLDDTRVALQAYADRITGETAAGNVVNLRAAS